MRVRMCALNVLGCVLVRAFETGNLDRSKLKGGHWPWKETQGAMESKEEEHGCLLFLVTTYITSPTPTTQILRVKIYQNYRNILVDVVEKCIHWWGGKPFSHAPYIKWCLRENRSPRILCTQRRGGAWPLPPWRAWRPLTSVKQARIFTILSISRNITGKKNRLLLIPMVIFFRKV